LAELGMFGSTFFLALFYYPLRWVKKVFSESYEIEKADYLIASNSSLVGIMMAMFFLSRSYILLPFMIVGMMTAIANAKNNESSFKDEDKLVSRYYLKELFVILISAIFIVNIMLKVGLYYQN
jgi:hypothetical protein